MPKRLIIIIIFVFLFIQIQCNFCKAESVNNLDDLQPVFDLAKKYLSGFDMKIKGTIKTNLASAQILDALYQGENTGAELGFYQFGGGLHNIYILRGLDYDRCLGTLVHELTHAWQEENCPVNQNIVIKEGFATWIEIKALRVDGSYSLALDITIGCQGNYWRGLKLLMDIEDKGGEKAVFDYVRKTVNP